MRAEDPDEPGAARLPASGDGRRRRGADVVLQAVARERRRLRRRDPRWASRGFCRARRSCTGSRSDPAGARPGAAHAVSDIELASRLSFFLWSSIPDREAAGSGRGRAAPRARRAGRAGAPDDRGRARRCAGQQFHRAVAAAAQPRVEGRARPAAVPRFRRQHPQRRSDAKPRCSSRTSCARTAARWSC